MRVLSRLFRRRFIEELARAHDSGQLQFVGEHAALADATAFAHWLAPLRKCAWVVYAKRPFAGPAAVLAYLSRYTHRVAISNQRLVAMDERGITFRWKDYRASGRTRYKTMTLEAHEFMRRFLLHVLPGGFASVTTGCLPMPGAVPTLRECVLCWGTTRLMRSKRRRRGRLNQSSRHSCARAVVRRCASSRPSYAISRSVRHRGHEARHDPRHLSRSNPLVGSSLAATVDRARHCLTPQKHGFRPPPSRGNVAESSSYQPTT